MMLKKLIVPLAVAAFVGALPLAWVYGIETATRVGTAESEEAQSRDGQRHLTSGRQSAEAQPQGRDVGVTFEPIPDSLAYTPDLEPRKPIKKRPVEHYAKMPPNATGVLIVKFKDEVQARYHPERTAVSRAGRNMDEFSELVDGLGLTVDKAFYRTEVELRKIEKRAELYSGKAQPDLAGMMHLTGPPARLLEAARILVQHDMVEFVELEEEMFPADDPQGCGLGDEDERDPGMCSEYTSGLPYCFNPDDPDEEQALCCETVCEIAPYCCDAAQVWDGRWCLELQAPACVEAELVNGPNGNWDINCVMLAVGAGGANPGFNLCPGVGVPGAAVQGTPTSCFVPGNNPCGVPGPSPGCVQSACCQEVCAQNPQCCIVDWDQNCVLAANEICSIESDPGVTPDFSGLQGYMTSRAYRPLELQEYVNSGVFGTYADCAGNAVPLPGWNGTGLDLDGLYELADFVLNTYQLGTDPVNCCEAQPGEASCNNDLCMDVICDSLPHCCTEEWDDECADAARTNTLLPNGVCDCNINRTLGASIRVGVIEHTAWVFPEDLLNEGDLVKNHEDLMHVISEPGQTPLILGQGNLDGHHGTACLSIIGAQGDNDIGMVGIAPEAEMYFFPIVSAEEGGRLGRAMLAALEVFEPGDVLSYSIGPGAGGTLATSERNWMLINLGTNLGITSLVAAGNSAVNLDGIAQAGGEDSGVVIVGAGYPGCLAPLQDDDGNPVIGLNGCPVIDWSPGNCHCRLPFSNYCQECEPPDRVHVQAWGSAVAAAGYGNYYFGINDGTYDPTFDIGPVTPYRSYTLTFGGTSAATPIVAGLVARLQGLAKQFYGIPLNPVQIRQVLGGAAGYGDIYTNQCGLVNPPGASVAPNVFGDQDLDAEPNRIGSFVNAVDAGISIMETPWFDFDGGNCSSLLDEVYTIRGTHLFGNTFSTCLAGDGQLYIARSEGTSFNSSPSYQPPGLEGPMNDVTYRATGQVADVLGVGFVEDPTLVVQFGVNVVTTGTTVTTIQHVELYDWSAGRWQWAATQYVPAGAGNFMATPPFATFNPQRFFNQDGKFLVRVWAFGFGNPPNPGGGFGNNQSAVFDFRVDMISSDVLNLGDVPGD